MKSKSIVLFVVAGGCGLLALLGFQAMQGSRAAPKVETMKVLVVTAEIQAGQALTEENVKFKETPLDSIPKDAVLTAEQYQERSALFPMFPGDTVVLTRLTEPGVTGTSTAIPKGWRVYTISANDNITASGMLHAGDRVDVLVTFKARTAKGTITKTKVLLEYVEVFATDDRTATKAADAETARAKNVSLLLTPEQVNFVILAMSKGQLQLSWRHRMDDQLVQADEVDDALLEELGGTVGMFEDQPLYDMASGETIVNQEPVVPAPVTPVVSTPAPAPAQFLDAAAQTASAPQPVAVVEETGPAWTIQVFNGNQPEVQKFAIKETESSAASGEQANWVSSGLKSLFGGNQSAAPATVN